MWRLVAAEWVKLRTTPLVWALLPVAVTLAAVAVAGLVLSSEVAGVALLEPTEGVRQAALHLTSTGAALVIVIGILISAGEYRTQTATDTFLTTPRRSRVLAAKLVMGGLLGLVLGVLAVAVGLPVAYLLFEADGLSFPADSEVVWLTLGGVIVDASLFAIIGIAFGSLIRSQVVAIVAALTFVLLVEQLLTQSGVPVAEWLPGNAGAAVVRTPGEFLDPGPGAALLLAYGLGIAVAGLIVVTRRDA
jgi:ABC-2 type transport system permease protein